MQARQVILFFATFCTAGLLAIAFACRGDPDRTTVLVAGSGQDPAPPETDR